MKNTLLVIVVLLVGGCGESSAFTQDEKKNIRHFELSLEHGEKATKETNRADINIKSIEERGSHILAILKHKKNALSEAKLVRDELLDKLNPELRVNFRDKYQRSLELFLEAFESGDSSKSIKSSLLHDAWVDWINENIDAILIPR
jgi:hypothetical protein